MFFEMWNDNEKPTKKSEKRKLGKDRWYSQIEQVLTSWSTWDRWDWDRGFFRFVGTGWDWDRGVFRLVGTGWDCDRGFFRLVGTGWD